MVEVEIGGVKRGFRLGMQTFRMMREITGIDTLDDVFRGIANNAAPSGHEKQPIRSQIDHVFFINDFLYACAKDYARVAKQPFDYTKEDISDWMDECGLQEAMQVVGKLIQTYNEKNSKAPATGQS
jgi:hypothetical protein